MIPDLKTNDEEGRARALERYEVLDTEEEQPFENVVNLVQQILQVPMCAVSLVDRHRQWFKARRGLDVCETARDISFCTHAIQHAGPFIVNDATKHPFFSDNPLVTGDPNIRSYAGIPLKTPDGYNVGSLCAIDTKPRDFPENEIAILQNFAKVVVDELELRQIASCDGLTGALTRRAWTEKATSEVERAKRYGRDLSLAILDIDKFKSVNDTYGHPAGDRVIQHLAKLCMDRMRQSDLFGRLGGEEFVLMMPETASQEALVVAERLRIAFAASPIDIDNGDSLSCTASFGIAELAEADTFEILLSRADRALYDAKEEGRNRTIVDGTPDLPLPPDEFGQVGMAPVQ